MTKTRRIQLGYFLPLVSVGMIIFVWSILSYGQVVSQIFLPDPLSVFKTIIKLFQEGTIWQSLEISFTRVLLGFLLSIAVSLPIGLMAGRSRKIKALFEQTISFLRFIPIAAFIPLSILWFGLSESEKIFLIFLGVLPYAMLYFSTASANVEKSFIEAGQVLGASDQQIFFKVILPRSLPQIWDICRIEMGGAWALVVLAEIVAANSGIGYRLVLAQRFMHTQEIFALIVIIGITGYILDLLFRISYQNLFPWSEKAKIR